MHGDDVRQFGFIERTLYTSETAFRIFASLRERKCEGRPEGNLKVGLYESRNCLPASAGRWRLK